MEPGSARERAVRVATVNCLARCAACLPDRQWVALLFLLLLLLLLLMLLLMLLL